MWVHPSNDPRQGETPDAFYIIAKGTVVIELNGKVNAHCFDDTLHRAM